MEIAHIKKYYVADGSIIIEKEPCPAMNADEKREVVLFTRRSILNVSLEFVKGLTHIKSGHQT